MREIKRAILLMNLGSPDSTSVKDVKKYLSEFLMDERVIDMPYIKRALLVKGIIIPFRAPKSAEAYKTIWTDKGSPLVEHCRQLREKIQPYFREPIEIAMRYGNPSPGEGLQKLSEKIQGLEEVIAVPLYPHYAMSSFETAVEHVKAVHRQKDYGFKLTFTDPFYNDPGYINALAEKMRPYVNRSFDHMLFSYHGVPARHIRKSDITGSHCLGSVGCCETASEAHRFCYRHQCITTTRLVTGVLGIPNEKYSISFQSRLGKGWLEPFTDIRLRELPGEGTRDLLILCPAFVSDCLETLEEIEERGKEIFLNAGGNSYTMIPCLNEDEPWLKALENIIRDKMPESCIST